MRCLVRLTLRLAVPACLLSCCKTYSRRAVTAEAAGSSPVVPAILFKHFQDILKTNQGPFGSNKPVSTCSIWSACHVQNCICGFLIAPQFFNGRRRGNDEQFDFATLCLAFYFCHYGQLPVGSGTDHQTAALPWNILLRR